MNTELKSKVARVADEFASYEFLQFPRDRAGLPFQLTETNTMFILTAHLKGCTRGNVKTDIIEDGTKMVVTCEKLVQETVTIGSKVIKKGVEIRKFRESFKIPDEVMVDGIKTNFNEETSILTITMPKRIKEAELVTQSNSENLPSAADETLKRATFQEDKGGEFLADSESAYRKGQVEKHGAKDEGPGKETEKPKAEPESQNTEDMNQETNLKDDQVCEKANGIQEEEEDKLPKRRNICVPVIVGSTIILSLFVFVIHFMRKKKQPGKRKE